MERTDVIEKLMHFNLNRQEALLYVCLWEHGNLSGYEAAKLTGISRSNVYAALSTLTDKGAAFVIESNTTLYQAVKPEEFLSNKLMHLEEDKQYLLQHMPQNIIKEDGYITIQGSRNIMDKVRYMIAHCELRLYLAACGDIIREFEQELSEARKRNLKIVIMSDADYSYLATQFYQDEPKKGQIRLITDSSYVLTGEIWGGNSDTCLYSGQKNLVTIMKETLKNKILLLESEQGKLQ